MLLNTLRSVRFLSAPILALLSCPGYAQDYAPGIPNPPACVAASAPTAPPGWPDAGVDELFRARYGINIKGECRHGVEPWNSIGACPGGPTGCAAH